MAVFFNKWFVMVAISMIFNTSTDLNQVALFDTERKGTSLHPFHVSVTEINHNAAEKTLETSCKIFTDDFENALSKKFNTKIDLINSRDRAAMDKYVSAYVHDHLQVKADGKQVTLNYLGYEIETEAAYVYLQADNISAVKKVDITNTIMYDTFTDQVGINHVIVGGNRKSVKLDYPNNQASLQF
jgi:hypothetical protein